MDAALFRWINQSLSNPLFDWLMPILSGNKFFGPMVLVAAVVLIWKQRVKGALCVAFITLAVSLGDPLIINSIKHAVARPRPFVTMPEALTLVGRTESFSLPSAHAANMAAAAMVAFLFYRRSWRFMVPLAAAVAFSRVYNGVHYVSDVLIGATLGAGYAALMVWALDRCWKWAGRKWFPLWWERLPSLLFDPVTAPNSQLSTLNSQLPHHWLRLGYLVIAVFFLARLAYIGGSSIELSEDEAYQWQWSKHPALAYYSKPPGIAVAQWIGTHLWGDTAFGVRFLAPCVTALMSVLLLRFLAREASAKLGLFVVISATATPLLSVGAVLMTVDCLSVLFWTLAMLSGWAAVRSSLVGRDSVEPHLERREASAASFTGSTIATDARSVGKQGSTDSHPTGGNAALRPWLWTGLWLGLGFLSKNTNAFQLICFALFFMLWRPARAQLRTSGPWLALGLVALSVIPQLVWNAQHGWATLEHLHNRAGLAQAWKFTPNYLIDFCTAELALLNPCFLALIFGGVLATLAQLRSRPGVRDSFEPHSERSEACAASISNGNQDARSARADSVGTWGSTESHPTTFDGALTIFLLCMGLPLFFGYFLYTLRARVQPNWIVPSVIPLLCLGAIQADACWRKGVRGVRGWFIAGLVVGLPLVVLLHDTNLTAKLIGVTLPPSRDPLVRTRGWSEMARVVEIERQKVIAAEGKPVFLIGAHYGITSLLSFYIPAAKAGVPQAPFVYYQSSTNAENQYGYWPGYDTRKGENAIFVQELKKGAQPEPPSKRLAAEFTNIEDLGTRDIQYRNRTIHTVRLLLCREFKGAPANQANARE